MIVYKDIIYVLFNSNFINNKCNYMLKLIIIRSYITLLGTRKSNINFIG